MQVFTLRDDGHCTAVVGQRQIPDLFSVDKYSPAMNDIPGGLCILLNQSPKNTEERAFA